MRKPSEVIHEYLEEYQEGKQEYLESGSVNTRCPDGPYKGDKRIAWLTGWLEGRTNDALRNCKHWYNGN
jgi:ribosome modulation factor